MQSQLYISAITGRLRGSRDLSVRNCAAIIGLAHLSAASYTEDTYGVVQKVGEQMMDDASRFSFIPCGRHYQLH